jgi:arabinan endo-1,5-alpha-L-arabinosidase
MRRSLSALVINVYVAIATRAAAFPDPLLLKGPFFFVQDPSLVQRDDGKYFLFTTYDKVGIITATHLNGCLQPKLF